MNNEESIIKEGHLNYAYPKMNMAMGNEDSLIYVTGTIYTDNKFNKCEMVLDTGSTSSGIAQKVVEKLKIPMKNNSKNSISIKLADGTTAHCKMTEKVKIIVNGRECEIEFFIVPHNEIEILLGIDWMRAMEASVHPSSKQVLRFPEKIIKWHCAE
jgi:predicted aspartyl protease